MGAWRMTSALHWIALVVDALSGFPWVWKDARFGSLLSAVTSQADREGRFTPGSVWMEWKAYCFGQKRGPSPWLTFVVHRALLREPARRNQRRAP